ncbi:L-lactate permease [Zhaonella formicivorans]|uniref:L-lactate permease n=1 Tax=Zhaonella formicivorans TaxID=2528593 RepID=UPI0010F3EDE4|nr:L-lactate permease [Zhaonella formicivorans]
MQGLPDLTIGRWLIAWIPIVLVLVLMMGFRWSGGKSGAVAWVASLIVGALFFGGDMDILASGTIKGLWTTVFVLYLIWGAMTLYNVVDVTGSFKVIASTFTRLTHGNKLLQLLVLGWAFPSFVQGVCGFGVPVAVGSPLLVGLGFDPIVAVVTALIGHSWSVTFGSLGSSYSVLVRLTDLDPTRLATFGALFLGIACLMVGFCIAHYYNGWKGIKDGLPAVLLIGGTMAIVLNIMANFVTPYVASFTAGICGLLVGGLVVTKLKAYKPKEEATIEYEKEPFSFATAFSAYFILIAVVFAIYLIKPVKDYLSDLWVLGLPFPETQTVFGFTNESAKKYSSIKMFTAPGTLIFTSAFLAYLYYRSRKLWPEGGGKMVLNRAVKQAIGATVTVLTMSMMAVVMMETGMTTYLAHGMAKYTGAAYAVISPFIGVLGAFMTGSNTNSNILFTGLQREVATLLAISPFVILGLQTTGGAIGNMFCPMNVALGTGVTNTVGREGECLKATTVYTIIQCLVVGVLAWLMLYVFFPGIK